MINEVYQLIAPKLIDTAYKEIDLSKNEVILRPVKMSICKADQRSIRVCATVPCS